MLKVQDVAERLNFSDQQVKNWIATGKLKAYKFGGQYRIKEDDLNEFIEKSMVTDSE